MPIQFSVGTAALCALGAAFAGAVVFFRWAHRHSLTDLGPGRKRFALGLRLLIVGLLFLALAGLRWVRHHDAMTVVFAVDASRSMSDAQKRDAVRFMRDAVAAKRRDDSFAVVTFADSPEIETMPGDRSLPATIRHEGPVSETNISQAIDASLPLIPSATGGKIVVLSDGNENAGHALAEAPTVTARGVRLEAVALPPPARREALIEKLLLPAQAKIGEPIAVRVVLNAANAQSGRLTLRRDGKIVGGPRDVHIPAGRSSQEFDVSVDQPGLARFEAQLDTNPALDQQPENNRGLGFVSVRGRPQVLYVASSPGLVGFLRGALKPQNIDVKYAPPAALPTSAPALQQYDSVIFSDVPRDMFTDAQLSALQVAVRDFGMGFAMIGGQDSFGLGGYRSTVVDDILPVSMDIRKMQRFPPVAVCLVIDRSGSMAGPKLDMAREAAIRAVQALKPGDSVAVVTFTDGADVQVPLTPVERAGQIISGIQQIGEGGGTSVYSGVELGYEQIAKSPDRIRHIILLTDGRSNQPEDYTELVKKMRAARITLSTVGIGQSAEEIDAPLLKSLAGVNGGRFYQVTRPADIPRIYLQEIERISSRPLVEEPFNPVATTAAEDMLPSVPWSRMPPLLGYNVTEAKPAADLLVVSHKKDPILAMWRYGLGRTMAFTSDDRNRWAAHWLPWGGYAQFWAQTIRWTMRAFQPSDLQTLVTTEGTRGRVSVDAIDREGRFRNGLKIAAKVASPAEGGGFTAQDLPLRQTAPGHYEASFDAARTGTYMINVMRTRENGTVESTRRGLAVPYSPEYRDLGANDFLMTQLARAGGGDTLTDPRRVFRANRPVVYAPIDLSYVLVLLAMLLWPLDVAVRRIAFEREDLGRAWRWIAEHGLGRRRHAVEAATPELARLKAAKARTQTATAPNPPAPFPEREGGGEAPSDVGAGSRVSSQAVFDLPVRVRSR